MGTLPQNAIGCENLVMKIWALSFFLALIKFQSYTKRDMDLQIMSNGRVAQMVQNLVVDQLLQREAHLHRSIIPTLLLLNFPSTRWTLSQQCSPLLSFISLWYKILLHMNWAFQLYIDWIKLQNPKLFIISIIHAFNIKLYYTQLSFANTNCIKLQNPNLYK